MKCLKMVEAKGTGHKNDIVILKDFDDKEVKLTREELKAAIVNHKLCVTNMEVTKSNRLVKVTDKVAWVNVELLSYDANNGICEVHMKSDNLDQLNEFMLSVNKNTISESEQDASVVYSYVESDKNGKHDLVIRWIHIDMVVNALQNISHVFALNKLLNAREEYNQNFAYMSDNQFSSLVDYLNNMLYCK